MKVLLADDHALFLYGLHSLLTLHGIQVVGIARNGLEAVEKTLELRPDIVLMDVRMPECDGVTSTRLIKVKWPECKIVMLTTSDQEPDLLDAIRSGACGYLLKTLEVEPFLTYLTGVERGEAAISRELAGILLKAVVRQEDRPKVSPDHSAQAAERAEVELTPRQLEILRLVAQGFSNKELAERLYLSEHTIKYHMGEIFQRLHLKHRDQAVNYAISRGLIKNSEQ
jgi:DNA-binding NarL/FixJ family response regulator